jgi:octaprenyl-diphosphate synthase
MSQTLQNILLPIQAEILELDAVILKLLDSEVPFVRTVAEYVLNNGGKRLRPILTILGAKLSGFKGEAVYKMASCIEFIHTASLMHDDVVDHAKIRRGRPSANAKWGNHVSVLVGDFFYCRGSQLLTEQGDLKILKIVTDTITATTEGEVLEIIKSLDLSTDINDYLAIINRKTALLIAAACEVGAALGNVSEDFQKALRNYGENLGMAFQLADDVLDYTSSEEIFGKANGIDLQEGKLTLPLIMSLKTADEREAKLIKNTLIAERVEKDAFVQVSAIIKKYRGFEATIELARSYVEKAKMELSPFRASLEKDILLALADYALERDR